MSLEEERRRPARPATVRDCSNESVVLSMLMDGVEEWLGGTVDVTTPARLAWRRCTRIVDGADVAWLTGLPAIPATDLVVASARSQLELEAPEVATSPPRGGVQLVGVPVWFWVDDLAPRSTTATIPGLSATLTATPVTTHVRVRGGTGGSTADHVTIDCPGGGTRWVAGRHDELADSDCSHRFDWNDTYTIDATVDWELAWTATNGQAGTLPPISRTSTFTLTVQQAQALTD